MSDWHDEHGVELKDPPRWVTVVKCPSCEMVQEERDGRKLGPGEKLAFRPVDDE